ncbi:GntR family transcriptional regulator [Kribbella sp. NPDC048928]|uniref:GntR family transcriptional regulator n=1 Tax=Kribbella sp. NPDC048928 TaxID=3364111 RepID=UPI0037188E3E
MMTSRSRSSDPSDEAYERLRSGIMRGDVSPGQRLVEADLVEALGVSRAVVRTTLTRLAHAGLVEKELNRGARVRTVSEEEAVEITQVRSVLEALASRQAAERATDADVEALRSILAEMKGMLAEQDLLGYSEGNSRLHAKVIEISGHQTVQRLVANLRAQMVRFQYRTILVPGRGKESFAEHTKLVEAIAAHDGDAAEAAMRTHLLHVTDNLDRTKNNRPGGAGLFGRI